MKEILTNGEAIKSLYPFGGQYQIWSKSFAFSRIFSISSHRFVILAQDKTTCANVTHMYQSPVFSWSRTRVNMGVICSFGSPLQLTKPKPACENLEMITINIFKVASIRRIQRILKQNNLNRAYTLNKMFL